MPENCTDCGGTHKCYPDCHADCENEIKRLQQIISQKECLQRWPEAVTGEYDPRCCRFPKSCSVDIPC